MTARFRYQQEGDVQLSAVSQLSVQSRCWCSGCGRGLFQWVPIATVIVVFVVLLLVMLFAGAGAVVGVGVGVGSARAACAAVYLSNRNAHRLI